MTGEDEDLATATSPAARKPGRRRSESAKTVSPEEAAADDEETAPTDEPGSTPAEETDGAQSESNSQLADRLDEVARATVNHLLRRYFRGVESGGRETAELELAESLARVQGFFNCVPAPADTKAGPWMPLTFFKGQENEWRYWGRPVYWLERQVVDQIAVAVMGTQAWGEACEDVYPVVRMIDVSRRPYTDEWQCIESVTAAEARELAAALAEAADKADLLEAARRDPKD